MGDLQTWAAAGIVLGVLVSALMLAAAVGRPLRKLAKQNDEFRQDWYGMPARPGHDPVPGVPERLRRMEKELHPNGGSTLRDAIGRTEARLVGVEKRMEDHIRNCDRAQGNTPT